ncbi:MAG: indolepyruvate ferredoxin oxidoreductase subunit alpha, partial [Ruminococcus sp.]|nr:indolepyruvate ferredoxin oxidoreductase subunit alpha [Ruminococcus sp.]
MKKLMLGNDAVARGLFEAGVKVASSYPGTPSTEITETVAKYPEIYAEWAPNEKVAVEVAIGASIMGSRSFAAMKHVGLNVAADPLYTASYTGVNGGLVVVVADDPGMHSSQNEQDSRRHAVGAKLPMLEPSDSGECKTFTQRAYELSEQFDTPVLLRLSTRVSHSQSPVEIGERIEPAQKPYTKDVSKYVMMPASAKGRHVFVEKRTAEIAAFSESSDLNRTVDNGQKIGVITSGAAYCYAREALGNRVNYLKLGIVNPLPKKLITDFAENCETVYVIEELDDVIETHCKKLGIKVIGKELFGFIGELSQSIIAEKILHTKKETYEPLPDVPVRPPVMCAGCPHRGVFYVLSKNRIRVSGDIGCYTLGASAPLSSIDTTVCMGASISGLHGMNLARPADADKSVAVIGDSTFMHSGVTGLINIAYNRTNSTVIVLDNSITGMTGHQQNPSTGINLKGDPTAAVDIKSLCKAVG